ncbi:hypothetical protein F0562_000155 [Nyssa sinensis]|uniref:Uncharacterized protein n=1 Tax=Nyssa sinensis TaxID=561372 RepID=A0A5J5C4E6_9ASTE|nr:hypothetical protein F0562_000155 [Nyssa sinensis]
MGHSNAMGQDDESDFIFSVDWEIRSIPPNHSEACIFKVHDRLREVNPKAYEPDILSIGPYHHCKDNLSAMQKHKVRYLQLLLQRRHESSVEKYIMAMRNLEEKARRFYENSINLKSDDFVKMMLFDGCFIIELFRKTRFTDLRDKNDPIFKMNWMRSGLRGDLLLFENQLPFFILVELFNMTKDSNRDEDIVKMAQTFFRPIMPAPFVSKDSSTRILEVNHLLGLMHDCFCSSFADIVSRRNAGNKGGEFGFIKSVIELEEAGIEFKKSNEKFSFFNIKFENGVMEIPPLTVADKTECVFRNLIAYEQYRDNTYPMFVSDYTKFMDCLVNSAEDVEKLRCTGIINNWLGNVPLYACVAL